MSEMVFDRLKRSIVVVGNVIGVFGLLASYVILFGNHSLRKFIERDVIVITHEESPTSIIPPGKRDQIL